MASSYTGSLGLEKQGDGENANTWGLRLNQSVIDLVDEAVAGYTTVALTSATQKDLTVTDGTAGTGDAVARNASLEFTGNVAGNVTVTLPAQTKTYSVINSVTNGGNVLIRNTGAAASTIVTVKAGNAALLATNGSQIKKITSEPEFDSGTRLAFNQDSAPTGWTVITSTSHENAALRIVNAATSGGQVGGNQGHGFTDVFNSGITVSITGKSTEAATLSGNVSATVLTTAQIPAHRHLMFANTTVGNSGGQATATTQVPVERGGAGASSEDHKYAMGTTGVDATLGRTSSIGSGDSHTHSIAGLGSHSHTVSIAQGSAFNLNVKYVNFIVCQKD